MGTNFCVPVLIAVVGTVAYIRVLQITNRFESKTETMDPASDISQWLPKNEWETNIDPQVRQLMQCALCYPNDLLLFESVILSDRLEYPLSVCYLHEHP